MVSTFSKAVIFRAPSIGDALMALYLFENIHAAYPHARCALVVPARGAMIRDLLAAYPWIEVVEASRRDPRAVLYVLKNFWRSDFVATPYTAGVVTLPTKLMARFLAKRGGCIGFADKSSNTRFFYDIVLPQLTRDNPPRLLEQKILKAAAIPVSMEWTTYHYITQKDILPRLGLHKERYIIVHLFAGTEARGLNPGRRQALVDALARQFPEVTLVFTGTAKDHALVSQLKLPRTSVLPDTTVQEMATLIDNSIGVVSVGTGPSHITSIIHKPLVVLCICLGMAWCGAEQYGEAPIRVFARPDLCSGGHNKEGYARCMNAIDMNEVAQAARSLFAAT